MLTARISGLGTGKSAKVKSIEVEKPTVGSQTNKKERKKNKNVHMENTENGYQLSHGNRLIECE